MDNTVAINTNPWVMMPAVTTLTVNDGHNEGMVDPIRVCVITHLGRAERLQNLLSFLNDLSDARFEQAFEILDEALWDWQFESTPDNVIQQMQNDVNKQIDEGKTYPIR